MLDVLRSIYRSFPVQLLLLHLRTNFLLLGMWLLLVLMMSGAVGQQLGLQYLFLDPEYLGETGYFSFLIVGLAVGFFTMSWNLSTYLLLGGYFNFLASLARPFYKYCINNALLPLGVFLTYCGLLVRFRGGAGPGHPGGVVDASQLEALSGLVVGLVTSLFIYSIYFNLTNRDIHYYTGSREAPPHRGPSRRRAALGYRPYRATALGPRLVNLYDNPFDVRFYLGSDLRPKRVRSVAHYETDLLRNIFRQNHVNALVLQFVTIGILIVLGLLIEQPTFQIPAGASFFILFSLFVSIIGAVSYWFSEWRVTLLVLLLLLVNFLTSTPLFDHGNQAYGLSYASRAAYTLDTLEHLYHPAAVQEDLAATEAILTNWRDKQTSKKPKLVILCASGGGLTASLWATHVTQTIEQRSGGRLLNATALMTGASGGLLGLAYLRETYRRDRRDFAHYDPERLRRAGADLLNPVAFSIVSNDIFLPFRRVQIGDERYRRDRGFAFEQAYNQATDYLLAQPLHAYRAAERSAQVPLLFVTPSIVEDGRRMVISPQGVRYMMAPPVALGTAPLAPDMVDFRALLHAQEADSLRLSSALRANASYPYVLPQVSLPTEPSIRLMDAGYRDNYGIASAARFVHALQDWIGANTSGVILVQLSAFREQRIPEDGRRGVISGLFSPLGVAGNILSLQILDQEELLAGLYRSLGPDRFHLFRFNYQPREDDPLRTSVSLHMTELEKRQVLQALDDPEQQTKLAALLELLGH